MPSPSKPKLDLSSLGAPPSGSPEEIARRLQSVWECSMQDEASLLQASINEGKTLEFPTHKELVRYRMRLYRCKRLLQSKGNKYVQKLTFREVNSRTLRVEVAGSIWGFVRESPDPSHPEGSEVE